MTLADAEKEIAELKKLCLANSKEISELKTALAKHEQEQLDQKRAESSAFSPAPPPRLY